MYRRASKEIVEDIDRYPSPLPSVLYRLFTLAHEFGHHLSHNNHKRVGRTVDYSYPPHALFEEYRAWQDGMRVLQRLGLKKRYFGWALTLSMGHALAYYVAEYEAHFWLTERLGRLKIHCPFCKSKDLTVIGAEGERHVRISCKNCGTHTKRRPTVLSIDKRLKNSTFTDVCDCKDHP